MRVAADAAYKDLAAGRITAESFNKAMARIERDVEAERTASRSRAEALQYVANSDSAEQFSANGGVQTKAAAGVAKRNLSPTDHSETTSGLSGPPTDRLFIGIEATDSGRLGTEIQHFGFQLPDKHHIRALADFVGQPVNLPMALGPGRTVTMRYNLDEQRAALASQGISGENVRPYVVTGHGLVEGAVIHLGDWLADLT
jgi:hypothetical protein